VVLDVAVTGGDYIGGSGLLVVTLSARSGVVEELPHDAHVSASATAVTIPIRRGRFMHELLRLRIAKSTVRPQLLVFRCSSWQHTRRMQASRATANLHLLRTEAVA
jgi:hypothetical protein